MRYIDPADVELYLPDDWAEIVRRANESVKKAVVKAVKEASAKGKAGKDLDEVAAKARAKAISARSSVWSEAGQYLRGIMHGKCWYCETLEIRADMPVDHFRPKNSVAECGASTPDTGGWRSSGGTTGSPVRSATVPVPAKARKGESRAHFPLLDPKTRAWTETDDYLKEKPELIDPCNPDDPNLLFFDEQGRTVANPATATGDARRRVGPHVRIYHLDHPRLKRERKRIVIKIREQIRAHRAHSTPGRS